jgi:hypothetical protein
LSVSENDRIEIADLEMFYEWALSNGEMRIIEDIPFPGLDGLLAKFYLGMF